MPRKVLVPSSALGLVALGVGAGAALKCGRGAVEEGGGAVWKVLSESVVGGGSCWFLGWGEEGE
jgi:hypothetical protein